MTTSGSGFNLNAGADEGAATAAPETSTQQSYDSAYSARPQNTPGTSEFDKVFYSDSLRVVPPAYEDYAKNVFDLLKQARPNIVTGFVEGLPNIHFFREVRADRGISVVVLLHFVEPVYRDERDIGMRREDLRRAGERMRAAYPNCVFGDTITIMPNYKPDSGAYRATVDKIITTMRYKVDNMSNLTVNTVFSGKTLSANYDVQEALATLAAASPHGVLPRVETAVSYQTIVNNQRDYTRNTRTWNPDDYRQNGENRPTTALVVGGYVEIGRAVRRVVDGREETRFETTYHITAVQSRFAVLGMMAMGLAAFSSHIINDYGWVPQFYNKKANGDIANLVRNEDEPSQLMTTSSNEDVMKFARQYCWKPVIVIDSMTGFDLMPGMNNLTTSDAARRKAFSEYLAHFFQQDPSKKSFLGEVARFEGVTLEGYYGEEGGVLKDTRNFDWFKLAALTGIDALASRDGELMRTLSRDNLWVMCRFQLMMHHLPGVLPMAERYMHSINPNWLNYVADMMTLAGIKIQDTSRPDLFASSVSSMASDWIVDRVNNPTSRLGGSADLADVELFGN